MVRSPAFNTSRNGVRAHLLRGASALALATSFVASPAAAQLALLHGAAHVPANGTGTPTVAVPTVPGLSTGQQTAMTRQLTNAANAQQAVNLAQQAQTAAQQAAAAQSGGSVPNGLGVGGLQPVANPVLAANDPTGLNTWQGANLPTQTVGANGAFTVDVQQTAARAVLDWTSFNVGANTTLNFDQSQNGVAQPSWVVVNRVVGQLNQTTGLRDPSLAPAPSQILGAIKSQGTVLVINQNGIIFGPTAQINTNALIATSLEIGEQLGASAVPLNTADHDDTVAQTLAQRDNAFLEDGLLLSNSTTLSGMAVTTLNLTANGGVASVTNSPDPLVEGAVTVEAGAQITSGQGGFIILAAPQVTNSGFLSSSQGQVSLVSGRAVTLTASDGTSDNGNNPDIRGLMITSGDQGLTTPSTFTTDYVENTDTGLIESSEGYASLTGSSTGTVINAGTITATTSVSRNGFIQIGGANIELAPTSVIAITPDDSATIPQDPTSLADFKPSQISIGALDPTGALAYGANIDIASGSLIYAPSANIYIGAPPGLPMTTVSGGQVFIDSGAVIDASGLKNVQIAASTNEVTIEPVTTNDTADTPTQRDTLDGTTVTVDPRLSGVLADGTTWVGSPLIPAQAFAEQVGVTASQLMTKGGNVVIGAVGDGTGAGMTPSVIIKPGAVIDISGGWETFEAGWVQTTNLVSADGTVVNIADASPDEVYLGVYNGFTAAEPRYGISQTYANPLLSGGHYEQAYTQGSDAGSLTVTTSAASLQGAIYADAFPGPVQKQTAQIGTGTPTVYGDQRLVQAVGSQLPVGGLLSIIEANGTGLAGGDIDITDGPTPDTTTNLTYGQTISVSASGALSVSSSSAASPSLSAAEMATLTLSAPDLSAMGLGQLSLYTSGALTVEPGVELTLASGGVFTAITGRAITIDGAITAPSGVISLATVNSGRQGSIFDPTAQGAGDYDVVINGQLSTAGLWVNDLNATASSFSGPAYTNGGDINITVSPREDLLNASGFGDTSSTADAASGSTPASTTDVSGSILIDGPNSLLDVSSGGYVAPDGALILTAKGGNVSLNDYTAYFPFQLNLPSEAGPQLGSGYIPGFRVNGIVGIGGAEVPINPSSITSQVAIGDGTIQGYGFGGGGVFSLTTPAIGFGDGIATSGSNLSLDFFSKAGFGTYDITSYGTDLIPNAFNNGLGGYNAVLATQILTVQSGQTLNLTQTNYSTHLTGAQIGGLRSLASGGRLSSIVTPGIMPDAYDQLPVDLDFGGLIEFEVAQGGTVIGAPEAELSAAQIYNKGVISLPGGTLSQSEVLPSLYSGVGVVVSVQGALTTVDIPVIAAASLSDIFSVNPDGSISENAKSVANPTQTNAQVAANDAIYLTGDLPASVGVMLAPGSVTDLSGTVVTNPYASGITDGRQVVTGTVINGGVLQTATLNTVASTTALFPVSSFEHNDAYSLSQPGPYGVQTGLTLVAAPGAVIDLQGAAGVFDQLTSTGQFVQSAQWSDGGSLLLGDGGVLTGAIINAHGGAPEAAGGELSTLSLTLTATDPTTPTANTLSAEQIEAAGFGSLVVQGDLTTSGGPVDLTLPQAFYLTGAPASTVDLGVNPSAASIATAPSLFPTVSVAGVLEINAPYIALDGAFQTLNSPTNSSERGVAATGSVVFNAQALDVTGAVLFDQAVANVTLDTSGDLRFTGVSPFQTSTIAAAPSLVGQLAVNGNLNLDAAQVYATTGSTFDVTSAAAHGTITITSTGATPAAAPYSAGSDLTIQAANIVQDGVVRAPVGSLTLGSNTPMTGASGAVFAPATTSVTLGAGSVTSVSADGLSIPYGTTTDQTEYYFTPTSADALTAPPAAVLTVAGQAITTAPGATVDLTGGGDLYAYEFIPGTGGSRDILSQFNTDSFTSNGGYQFPDHRQVYAIVPGLSNAPVAAYDPIYSSNYSALYGPSQAGQRVYLDGGQGVAAGWYTLLPAQYALLPGGMEVVEDTSAATVPVGSSQTLADGSVAVTGQFGGLGGSVQSTAHVFDIKSQAVINAYSDIARTSADSYFAAQAAANGVTAPRLPLDAGRLVINPGASLNLDGLFETTPGQGGRGSEVDISASVIDIVSTIGSSAPGVVQLSADQLTGLNADSLLIGGVRTDNADGTTTLDVTTRQITVENSSAHTLSAADIVLAVDGSGADIVLKEGASITALGTDTTGQTGNYVIDGATAGETGVGALVRVSNGPQRLLDRDNVGSTAQPSQLTVGAAALSGTSVMLDSNGGFSLSPSAALNAGDLTLDASTITFAPSAQGLGGLVITPSLLADLGQAQSLTLRTSNVIGFADGDYSFGALNLDAPGVSITGGSGAVNITAGAVQAQNSFADAGGCAGSGALDCGGGQFTLAAQTFTFGDGTFRIYGAGQGVTLAAPDGLFYQGQGMLDVGVAPLTIQTAFLGDQVSPTAKVGVAAELPSLTISTTNDLTLTNAAGVATPSVSGTPGASLTLSANDISVTGVDVRATAGSLTLNAAGGVIVGAGATLETPGFSESFGDAADPYSETAPGGLLTINAANGNITFASGSTVSVGGGVGAAGSLVLNAGQGSVAFGGAINATAPTGGANFQLNEAGAFDLTGFEQATNGAFNGDFIVQSGTGNLTLGASQSLTAAAISLTANGGLVDIAGTIDTSGVNGGDIGLYGAGVTLESTAQILVRANGYGPSDTRQASGGNVELGTTGAGALTVVAGATIDVSALNPNARIVEGEENGLTTYNYVAADQGGTVTLRVPVTGGDGAETVNVAFAGSIKGASSIVVEGYKAYDLGAIAASGQYSGVTVSNGTATLDTTATGAPNFLADDAPGTLVDFIQNFNISGSYANLGGLASLSNFHARPGVELDYSGDITLASNWNLGAGTVNVAGAYAAGLMVQDPQIGAGVYSVVPGDEAAIFANYTTLTYRVGGSVLGEPGDLAIKAGGNLTLEGSITDGFFTFGDQTDARYIKNINNATYAGVFSTPEDQLTSPTLTSIGFALQSSVLEGSAPQGLIPYDAAANTPGALGTDINGNAVSRSGNPIGSAEIFPLVQTAQGSQAVNSWSYQLTGGAAQASANPQAVQANPAAGAVTVQGSYTYQVAASTSFTGQPLFNIVSYSSQIQNEAPDDVSAADWENDLHNVNGALTPSAHITLTLTGAPAGAESLIQSLAVAYFKQHAGQYSFKGSQTAPTSVATTVAVAAGFLQVITDNWSAGDDLQQYYSPTAAGGTPQTVTVAPLIRTGTGSIHLAAAGDIDLRDGATTTYLSTTSGAVVGSGYQEGGAAVYTAGAPVIPGDVTAVDTTTGATVTLDPSAFETIEDNIGAVDYGYGIYAPVSGTLGLASVLVANAFYASGGGDVSLTAGGDILGRRNTYITAILHDFNTNDFVGDGEQPWRTGTIGAPSAVGVQTNILINPQLFTEGVATLGGGDVSLRAGGQISDLTVVADTTATTGTATGGVAAGQVDQGQMTFGGGNVNIFAGGDLIGGRIDVASGQGDVSVGGAVISAGTIEAPGPTGALTQDDTLRLRLTDATIDLTAHGEVDLQGVTALGVQNTPSTNNAIASDDYAVNYFSPTAGVSIVSDGSITFANTGADVLTPSNMTPLAVLPGSLTAVSLEGSLNLNGNALVSSVLLDPSPVGTLTLAAGANIDPVTLAMLDSEPSDTDAFPFVLPNFTQAQLQALHDPRNIHADDPVPNRIYAGGDIEDVTLSTPKQTRIGAGQDIVNMMFFGQNLNASDVTRIVAGRDITATSVLETPYNSSDKISGPQEPTVQGNTFILGGPGSFMLEAGRNLGPFMTSATLQINGEDVSFPGGIVSVGNAWNPNLAPQGANLYVEFGVAKGEDFGALMNYYLDPANQANLPDYLFNETLNGNNVYVPDRSQPIYASQLIAYMQAQEPQALTAAFGTTSVTYAQAYQAFTALPALQQEPFLLQIYFSELSLTSVPGPTFHNYQRGYTAVNLLFPSSLGYTANNLTGGTNGANAQVQTGDLDLRLATIETQYGGNIDILGPGGRVLAGSTVATAQQASRRNSAAPYLYAGSPLQPAGGEIGEDLPDAGAPAYETIQSIPAGYEGVLTLRGGNISTFTDGDFVLNQSRLFTELGGDIIMWSSNGDLNAGEGPKTSSDFPPATVSIDDDAFSQQDQTTSVTGAGIAAFEPAPGEAAPNVYLVAPRGTVDAGAAGVRVAGNLFVAALHVANADNFQVSGTAIGLPPTSTAVSVAPQATAASAAATQAVQQAVAASQAPANDRSVISVEVLGFGDGN